MNPVLENHLLTNRRTFFGRSAAGIGGLALADLLGGSNASASTGLPGLPHFAPKAKRIIYLFQSGAPSQMELFDYKPSLEKLHGTELPDSVRQGQRLTGMTSGPKVVPGGEPVRVQTAALRQSVGITSASSCRTRQKVADEMCVVKSMYTEAINHDPAITFFQTGTSSPAGRASARG